MGYIRFEEIRVFQLAENLSDKAWNIICQWENFNNDIKGNFQ